MSIIEVAGLRRPLRIDMMKATKRTLVLFLAFLSLMASAQAQNKKPNVLFIVVDDLNDYIALLKNYPLLKTPNLDRLAKSSVNFTRSYCAAPVCNPSRAAVLSGLAPYKTGVYDNADKMQASKEIGNATLLPEHFKANGYTTITRGKIFHTLPGAARYRAMWDEDGGKGDYGPYTTQQNVSLPVRRPNFNYQEWTGPESDHPDNVTAEYAMEQLARNYEKPFFMAYGLYKPHNPWTAPKRFFDMYPLDKVELPPVLEADWDDLPPIAKEWAEDPVDFEHLKKNGQWKAVVRSYLACISFMDWNLGRILDALEKSRYTENTIVCLFADNGFHLGEKKHFTKFALWEQTTHVMQMWRVPGLTNKGKECHRTVTLQDIYPTLNELCGFSSPKQKLDGRSLAALLKNPEAVWNYPALTTFKEGNQSIRTEKFRYIRYNDGEEELYDEEADPREWKNLAKEPGRKALLDSFRKLLIQTYTPGVSAGAKKEADGEEL